VEALFSKIVRIVPIIRYFVSSMLLAIILFGHISSSSGITAHGGS